MTVTTVLLSGMAAAQEQDVVADDRETTMLAPITVTARHIEESIQRIPFAITAAGGEELRREGVNDTQSLARRVPNFNHADSGLTFANLVNMRGIGSSSALISPSVHTYIDGIPVPPRIFDMPFGDVERIEMLRGPQGTHFGLNAQAGAVSIVTRDPSPVAGGSAGIIFGSHGRKEADFTLEGPLSDAVSGRISGRIKDFDGDLTNVLWPAPGVVSSSDKGLRARTYGALSGKLLFEPDEVSRLTLSGSWSRDRQNPTTGVWLDDPGFPRNALNPLPETETETAGFGAKYERDLEWARFTSISGIQHYSTWMEADIVDGFIGSAQTGAPGFALQAPGLNVHRIDESSTQLSQEFRLDGETAGGTRWVAGLSGLWSRFDSTTDITSMAMPNGSYRGRIDTTNLAAFGEVTVPLSDRLNWIGGLRLTHESKDFEGRFLGRAGALPQFDEAGRVSDTFVTGRTGLTYDLTEDLTAFATVARGEKTGGYLFYNQFAAMGIPLTPYRSSNTWSYEAGLKAADLGGWLDLSASVFYNDTRDEQLFTYNPVLGRFSVENADTRSYGAELEAVIRPTAEWSLGANIALLNAEITGGNPLIRGKDVPYAPSFSGMLHAEYRRDIDFGGYNGTGFVRAEYSYTGGRQIDPANSRKLDGYGLANLRAGWQGDRLEVFGAVENLFDKSYVTSAFQAGTDTAGQPVFAGVPGKGRTFALGARVSF
ncbi:MAG: TonB-dependent receptor [Rhizobiaceae bacterium]|nr:TonB-dependent receptor [Rhizobiaceae bacterium]